MASFLPVTEIASRFRPSLASSEVIRALIWWSLTLAASYSLAVISLVFSCWERVDESRAISALVAAIDPAEAAAGTARAPTTAATSAAATRWLVPRRRTRVMVKA